ncbi:MAG: T9SS type A sorting domain-containing protein [Bacteroidales bacterium]
MKKIIFTILVVFMAMFTFTVHAQTVFLNEHFDYTAGDTLSTHGWQIHSTGVNSVLIKNGSLNYPQYPVSVGNKAYLMNTGQDINRTFTGQNSGTIYASALVKIDSAITTGEYFMHFLRNTTNFAARVYVKKSTTNPSLISFGILKGSTSANTVYSAATYSIDSTFLLVIKYKFVSGTANDSVSLFINPGITEEGLPTIKATDITSTDLDSAYSFALRQGTSTNTTYLNVDEIRIANTWYNAVGFLTTPILSTGTPSNITTNFATVNGNIITNGGSAITARGICYDTLANPGLTNLFTSETGSLGSFSSNLSGLLMGKTYHYRAYATNGSGTAYGADSVFSTATSAVLPLITTNSVSNISNWSATFSGNIINDGGTAITSRGFCRSTISNPTLTDSVNIVSGTTGIYTYTISNLLQNTTYHIRAFATNSVGTSYGNDVSFATLIFIPTYSISQIHSINPITGVADSLAVNCKLSGVVHGLNYITTGYSFYMMNNNEGIFVYKTSSLGYTVAEGDSLRVIGKTQQSNGLIYIAPDSIVKISSGITLQNPIVINNLSDTVESKLVKINNLTYLSGWPTTVGTTKTVYALHGTDSVSIIIYSSCNIQGTTAPTASFNITGIATQSDASSPYLQGYMVYPRYLSDFSINYTIPTVITTTATNISMTTAICSGNVTANGGSAITARGICYSTSANPDTSSIHTTETGTTGVFNSSLSGLSTATLYHFRAYAKNTTGIAYGADSIFTTAANPVTPLLTTDSVFNIGIYNATIASKVINDGGATVISRGVCWSTINNPTILDSINYQTGTTGAYIDTIGNLLSNTIYYTKAFATNSAGTAYGNMISFTTKLFIPAYSIQKVKGINSLGVSDSLNINCKLTGIVHGLNYATSGYNFYILDSTSGINVYKTSSLNYTPTEGNKVRVIGKIAQVNGLIEIIPDSIVLISTLNTLQIPSIVNSLTDSIESKLVKLNNLIYLSGWPTTAGTTKTVYTLNGADSLIIIIHSSCNLQGTAAPTTNFNITGLVSQNDASSPYLQSYTLYPRYLSDLSINYSSPTVLTSSATNITMTTAVCSGNITATGGTTITARGICYATIINPDTSASHTLETGTTGSFSSNLIGLSFGTNYHYRAYARNSTGVAYGADSVFFTSATAVIPILTTDSVNNISTFTANVVSKVVNDGGSTILTKGVCYSILSNPTILDTVRFQTGTTANYSTLISNLLPSTTYYVKAFATNAIGCGYGNQLSFTSKIFIPSYSILQVKGVNSLGVADSLNVNCKLTGVVHGLNYATTGLNFFILDSTAGINVYKTTNLGYSVLEGDKVRIIGKTAQVNGLIEIVPDSMTVLSSANTLFNPVTVNLPYDSVESKLVTIDNLYYLSGWPTTAGNTRTVYTVKGMDTVVLRIYSNCNLQGTAAPTATVSFSIKGLVNQSDATSPYTSGYQILPRNISDLIINYGNPSIITGTSSSITLHTAVCSGNIPTDGGRIITSRGICYSTNPNPTIIDSIKTSSGTTGVYSVNLPNLTANTVFHYRAYCINSLGTFYGNDSTFQTTAAAVVPVVTTAAATAITFTSASVSGTIISDGGDTIISRGICWATHTIPTITDSFSVVSGSTGTYSSTLNNLTNNTNYYVRAYGISAAGIGYGNEIIFTTKKLPVSYTIAQVKTVNSNGVADSIAVNCKLNGVVHGLNYKQSAVSGGLNFYLLDATAGINVYKTSTLSYTPVEGDSLRVIGKIAQVSGLTEIVPDSIVVISSGNSLHIPVVVATLTENVESQFVKMENLTYLSGWPTTSGFTTFSVLVLKGIDTVTLRLFSNCNLQAKSAPTVAFNITGIVSQIDATSPYLSGYVLIPRDSNDLQIYTTKIIENNSNSFRLFPNPTNGKLSIAIENTTDAEIKIYSLVGNMLLKQRTNQMLTNIDLSSFSKGVYFVNIVNTSNGKSHTEKLILQ